MPLFASISYFGLFILLVTFGVVGPALARDRARSRERLHIERMRALELGRPLPEGRFGATLVCLAIGGLVPVVALGVSIGILADGLGGDASGALAFVALLLGGGGLACGTYLARRLLLARPEAPAGKPAFDPDAYDLEAVDTPGRSA